ncbi:hypothetical protein LIER_15687 [Lithospermum erythrorhizon]|uniref:Uncharacterized protein n=1 Tax=Lithospermum erythrorhizon TaxID=34254 RepID=A0AAV3Q5R8_LITER
MVGMTPAPFNMPIMFGFFLVASDNPFSTAILVCHKPPSGFYLLRIQGHISNRYNNNIFGNPLVPYFGAILIQLQLACGLSPLFITTAISSSFDS